MYSDTGQHYYKVTNAPVAVSASSSTAACWIPGSRPRCSSLEAVSLMIEAIGRLSWHVAVDSFRHVVVQQVLLASLEMEVKTRRRVWKVGRWRRTCRLWYEMACFLRPSCDRAATFRAAMDRITVKVPQIQFFDVNVVVLGPLSVNMQRQVPAVLVWGSRQCRILWKFRGCCSSTFVLGGFWVETLLKSVEVPQLLFVDTVVVLPVVVQTGA